MWIQKAHYYLLNSKIFPWNWRWVERWARRYDDHLRRRNQMRLSVTSIPKVSPLLAVILGAILAAAEGAQINISMSIQAHDAITLVITLLSGLGVLVATPSVIAAVVPHQVLLAITALLGTLNVVQTSSFNLSTVVHTIIAVLIVIGNSLFTVGPPVAPAKV